jgi:hypothetical protein
MDYNFIVFNMILLAYGSNCVFSSICFAKKRWGEFAFHTFLAIVFAVSSILMNMGVLKHV